MKYTVTSQHAEQIGYTTVEPGQEFDDKDLTKDQKEALKSLEDQGKIVKSSGAKKEGENA
jgi:hypothetical protein